MYVLKQIDLNNIVFIDIETAQLVKHLQPDTPLYESWKYKIQRGREIPDETKPLEQLYDEQASLYPEFAKIICVTIGKIKEGVLKLKTFTSYDEKQLLTDFCNTLNNITAANKRTVLCGHAIKGFDIPWLMRRCIINQIPLPLLIDVGHLKPWEQTSIDTNELWKAGGFNGGSLISISTALGLSSPKDDMFGYQSSEVYHSGSEDALQRIAAYCEKDVHTIANIVMCMRYEQTIEAEFNAEIKEKKVGLLERTFNTKTLAKEDEKTIVEALKNIPEQNKQKAQEILDICVK